MKKNLKLFLILTIVIVFTVFASNVYIEYYESTSLTGDGLHGLLITKEEKYFYKKLKQLKPFNPSGKDTMLLKEMTNFEWDEVLSNDSYSPIEQETHLDFYKNKKLVQKIRSYGFYFYNFINDKGYIYFVSNAKLTENNIINLKVDKEVTNRSDGHQEIFYKVIFINN